MVGSPIANRTRAETEGLIGFFVNTLVLRAAWRTIPPSASYWPRTRETTLAAYAHQDLPFEKLVDELQPERDPGRSPLFQALFILQNAPSGPLELPGLTLTPLPGAGGDTPFDLVLSLWPSGAGLTASFQYATDLFDPATIARLARQLRTLLAGAAAAPDSSLSDLPLLSAAERHQLLEWSAESGSRVLDARRRPVPIGVEGELFAGEEAAGRRARFLPSGRVEVLVPGELARREASEADLDAEPRTPVEREVAAIWRRVLGVERVGLGRSFFALGGHSLLATQALALVRDRLGVEVPLSAMFDEPTVAALSRRVEAAPGRRAAAPSAELTREEKALLLERLRRRRTAEGHGGAPDDRPAEPLSFAQQRLWFLSRLAPASAAYNIPIGLRLTGRLEVGVLAAVLNEIVRRHEALRTRFDIRGGQPVQIVEPAMAAPLPLVDLSLLGDPARRVEEERLAREEVAVPFDLAALPLLRLRLVRSTPFEHLLLVTLHHVTGDAWSVAVVARELAALYPAFLAGLPSPLPELPLQYPEYARRQREALKGEILEREVGLWRRRLAGARPLDLPLDRPRPAAPSFAGESRVMALSPELAARARELARDSRASLFMVLLALFEALLSRLAGSDDVVVGTTVSGRARPEVTDLIGFFVNTLVMRTDLGGDPDGWELLARARETSLFAFDHQDLPFEKLVDELGLPRDPYRSPLLRALIQLHVVAPPVFDLPGLKLEPYPMAYEAAKFDLIANFVEVPGTLAMDWRFDADLFEGATVERLSRSFLTLGAALLADPNRRLSELPLLSSAERHQLAVEWNPVVEPARGREAVHRRFEAVVDRHPERSALTTDGESLTYAELDARANRLARHLLAAGVRPGDLVGLCLERSVELVVAILAVLKAGAAYLPLDPAYPAERSAFALEDGDARS